MSGKGNEMNNSILDNELVKKFFGDCEHGERSERGSASAWHVRVCMADKVLRAQQEPIREGEFYLWIDGPVDISYVKCSDPTSEDMYHPNMLRLPDKFQKKEIGCSHGSILRNPQSGNWYCESCRITLLPQEVQKRECECGLHDKNQPYVENRRECTCVCRFTGVHCSCKVCHQPQREAVENFIQRIIRTGKHPNPQKYENVYDPMVLEQFLRELVRLVEEGK